MNMRLAEQLAATRVGAAAKGVEVGGNTTERTRTEDGMEGARQGAEGEGSKEGADLLRGGARRRTDTDGSTSANGKASRATVGCGI